MPIVYQDVYEFVNLLDKWARLGPPDVEAVRTLFQQDPDQARHVGMASRTLVHLCCQFHAFRNLPLLQVFVEAYPEALFLEDDHGHLPLHMALHYTGDPEDIAKVVQYMLDVVPDPCDILLYQDSTGRLPLHHACESEFARSLSTLTLLVDKCPQALQHYDNRGRLPLHYALWAEGSRSRTSKPRVLKYLILQCNDLLQDFIPDDVHGQLPLHQLVRSSSRFVEHAVSLVAQAHPEAMLLQDLHGYTPLCLAASLDYVPLSVVYGLVRAWPEQVLPHKMASVIFDPHRPNGEISYTMLASRAIRLETVQLWTKYYGNRMAVVGRNRFHGRAALHYAVVSQSPDAMAIVQHLLKTQPETVRHVDVHGRLPLHYAVLRRHHGTHDSDDEDNDGNDDDTSTTIIRTLVDAYPDSLAQTDKDNGLLPWHYAQAAGRGDHILDETCHLVPDLDAYLVPEEVRWDLVQLVGPDDDFHELPQDF